jgi:hypothetical protein
VVDTLTWLHLRAEAVRVSGPLGKYRGPPRGGPAAAYRLIIDLDQAVVRVTDEAALRTILRLGRPDRPVPEAPSRPVLRVVAKDGAA